MKTVKPIQRLIDELQKLPSIGPKSAARLTYFLLRAPKERVQNLAEAILNLKEQTKICEICFNIAENSPCEICADDNRDHSVIMVTEEPMDVVAIENTGKFNGVYHVLGGVINPPAGIGIEELRIMELVKRLSNTEVLEVILATNPTTEGEATAMYIAKKLKNLKTEQLKNFKITRIARGLPTGGDLDYADERTLTSALAGRVEY